MRRDQVWLQGKQGTDGGNPVSGSLAELRQALPRGGAEPQTSTERNQWLQGKKSMGEKCFATREHCNAHKNRERLESRKTIVGIFFGFKERRKKQGKFRNFREYGGQFSVVIKFFMAKCQLKVPKIGQMNLLLFLYFFFISK